jgi:Protein phosphatase 2C
MAIHRQRGPLHQTVVDGNIPVLGSSISIIRGDATVPDAARRHPFAPRNKRKRPSTCLENDRVLRVGLMGVLSFAILLPIDMLVQSPSISATTQPSVQQWLPTRQWQLNLGAVEGLKDSSSRLELFSKDAWHPYEGAYQFVDSPWCAVHHSAADTETSRCHIAFPDNNPRGKDGETLTKCTPFSGLWTKIGDKGSPPASKGDDDDDDGATKINQDQIVLIHGPSLSFLRNNETDPQRPNGSNIEESWFLAGLFDGNGAFGHVASYIAATTLPALLLQALQRPTTAKPTKVANVLDSHMVQQAFDETDALAMNQMPNEAGTTAVIAWQQGTYVHMASVGDSTAFLVQWLGTGRKSVEAKVYPVGPFGAAEYLNTVYHTAFCRQAQTG